MQMTIYIENILNLEGKMRVYNIYMHTVNRS